MRNSIPTSNPSFVRLLQNIQKVIPQIMFIWILITYAITSVISIYFIPLPLWITIPIALIIQGSRFLAVFINFLNNPNIFKSDMPKQDCLICHNTCSC